MMARLTFLVLTVLLISQTTYSQSNTQSLFEQGNQAYEKKEYSKFLNLMREVDELRPNHPRIVLNLAKAYALTGRKTRSIQQLRKLMLLDANIDFESETDLQSLKGYKGYQQVVNLRRMQLTTLENDELYRTIDANHLHPESFVLLDNGEILLGSVREKKIVKVDEEGRVSDWARMPFSVMGMKPDPKRNTIWVSTAALPEMQGYKPEDKGKSTIFQIDVKTAQVMQGIGFEDEEIIGDIVLDSASRIWMSNSMTPYLSRDNTDTLLYIGSFVRKQFDLGLTHFNLQGLTLNEDESALYFSDYVRGIFKVDIASDNIDKVQANSDFLPVGIDGLYYYDNSLIAIHNGVKPFKVVQYLLDEYGENIVGQKVINRGGASLGEPTLGQIKDGYFYYIANSPWGAYDEDKNLLVDQISQLEIRRIKL